MVASPPVNIISFHFHNLISLKNTIFFFYQTEKSPEYKSGKTGLFFAIHVLTHAPEIENDLQDWLVPNVRYILCIFLE